MYVGALRREAEGAKKVRRGIPQAGRYGGIGIDQNRFAWSVPSNKYCYCRLSRSGVKKKDEQIQ